jgi:hypothetical protein
MNKHFKMLLGASFLAAVLVFARSQTPHAKCERNNREIYGDELSTQVRELTELIQKYRCPFGINDKRCRDSEYTRAWSPPMLPEFKHYLCCYPFARKGEKELSKKGDELTQVLSAQMGSKPIEGLCWYPEKFGRFLTCDCVF